MIWVTWGVAVIGSISHMFRLRIKFSFRTFWTSNMQAQWRHLLVWGKQVVLAVVVEEATIVVLVIVQNHGSLHRGQEQYPSNL